MLAIINNNCILQNEQGAIASVVSRLFFAQIPQTALCSIGNIHTHAHGTHLRTPAHRQLLLSSTALAAQMEEEGWVKAQRMVSSVDNV